MTISGFTYLRNSITYGYPFLQSIQSVLPICDEFIIALGDSNDGTKEAIEALNSPKIRIIDTVWDQEKLLSGGNFLAEQCNIALKEIKGDWGIHIQSDEVIHEDDLEKIKSALKENLEDEKVEGFLLKFIHFFGDYKHIGVTRRWHRHEIRIIRNNPSIYSYNDSMGFRVYPSADDYQKRINSRKLNVKKIDASVFHYSYSRNPSILLKKAKQFDRLWHDEKWIEKKYAGKSEFDFSQIDYLEKFNGKHPAVMNSLIAEQDWKFEHKAGRTNFKLKEKVLYEIEKLTGWRVGEYRNYKLIK